MTPLLTAILCAVALDTTPAPVPPEQVYMVKELRRFDVYDSDRVYLDTFSLLIDGQGAYTVRKNGWVRRLDKTRYEIMEAIR